MTARYDNALDALAVFEAIRDDNPVNLHTILSGHTDGELLEGFYVLTESFIATIAALSGDTSTDVVDAARGMYLAAGAA